MDFLSVILKYLAGPMIDWDRGNSAASPAIDWD